MSQGISYDVNNICPFIVGPTGSMQRHYKISAVSGLSDTGPTGSMDESDETDSTCCDKAFINVYSITEQTIDNGSPIKFDTHSACCGDCYHAENSTDIWLWKAGYYQVSVNIYSIESVQFSLVMNDSIVIPGTTFGSLTGLSSNNMTAIICIEDSDMDLPLECSPSGYGCKLQVVNNTCYLQYITLYGSSCSSNIIEQNTASMTIVKL